MPTKEQLLSEYLMAAMDNGKARMKSPRAGKGGEALMTAAENVLPFVSAAKSALEAEYRMKKGGTIKKAAKAIGEYVDPATESIEDWVWKNMPEVAQKIGLKEVPDYIQKGFGEFMGEQAKRAGRGEMSPRDLIKAYTITRSSVNRGSLPHSTATKTGMKLPVSDEPVRPEGAFSEWLGSPEGQQYLDAAQRGEVNPKVLRALQEKFSPFGMPGVLADDMRWAAENLSDPSRDINAMILAGPEQYRELSQSVPGIGPAKSGFMGAMLGRGDFPTLDARQLRLHTEGGGKEASKFMKRRKGEGGEEAVARLAARQDALDMTLDPSLDPFYQHLVHHTIWDRVGGNQTTHEDLVRAMRSYKEGGEARMAKGGIGKNVGRGMAGLTRSRQPLDPKEIQAMMLDVSAGVGVPFAEAGAEYLRGNVEDAEFAAAIDAGLMAIPGAAMAAKPVARAVKRAMPVTKELLHDAFNAAQESGAIVDPRMHAIAYHGSPHKFEKFDASKIGTGEGAQAFGHGLYFAENPKVASEYAQSVPAKIAAVATLSGKSPKNLLKEMYPGKTDDWYETAIKESKDIDAMLNQSRNLYKVDIPDESIARMLDWDKPLGEQSPKVRKTIEKTKSLLPESAMADLGDDLSLLYGPDVTPSQFLNTWEALAGNVGAGERALRESGVPGVKYLDAGSRSAGEGTRNFVVFPGEEETVKILERKKKGGKVKSAADMFHAKGLQALMDFDNKTKKRKG